MPSSHHPRHTEAAVSETYGDEEIGERDERDGDERDKLQDELDKARPGRLDERAQRQHAEQQHGDTFDVGANDTNGIDEDSSWVKELPGGDDEPVEEYRHRPRVSSHCLSVFRFGTVGA
jgi:hypothetical protein